jgi:hypothetical protein
LGLTASFLLIYVEVVRGWIEVAAVVPNCSHICIQGGETVGATTASNFSFFRDFLLAKGDFVQLIKRMERQTNGEVKCSEVKCSEVE